MPHGKYWTFVAKGVPLAARAAPLSIPFAAFAFPFLDLSEFCRWPRLVLSTFAAAFALTFRIGARLRLDQMSTLPEHFQQPQTQTGTARSCPSSLASINVW